MLFCAADRLLHQYAGRALLEEKDRFLLERVRMQIEKQLLPLFAAAVELIRLHFARKRRDDGPARRLHPELRARRRGGFLGRAGGGVKIAVPGVFKKALSGKLHHIFLF